MSEKCKWLHETLEELPLIKYPFKLESLPYNGIYFLYEEGETWGHGGSKLRIVRIGAHRGDNNFRARISEHFLTDESRMNFDRNRPKPSDRSIFRKNIGRALLNRNGDPYLETWNIDFTQPKNRNKFGNLRDVEKEKSIEWQITEIIRSKFSFRFIIAEKDRQELERKLIGTVSRCAKCKPSQSWLGNYSPEKKIKESGLWNKQHLGADEITEEDMETIRKLVLETKEWIENKG